MAYYGTKEGKGKKRAQNDKRRRQDRGPASGKESDEDISHPEAGDGVWNERMVAHVRMAASLIEGRRVSTDEILKMLLRVVRQHSLGRRLKIDYIVGYLNKASP